MTNTLNKTVMISYRYKGWPISIFYLINKTSINVDVVPVVDVRGIVVVVIVM